VSPQEILQGCRTVLGVFFSTEEANLFTMYLDSDGSGDVDLEEFVSKLSLTNLHREAHKFQISEVTFIERMLTEWYFLQRREKEACFKAIKKYDENNDGVFQI
jgi:Ca2+-binding EF-hand superfamily protein